MMNCSILIGRFNPPSIAHQKLIMELIEISNKNNLEPVVFIISGVKSSKNRQKNPLNNYEVKYFLRKMFPNLTILLASSVYDVSIKLNNYEMSPKILLCGEDRVGTYKTFFKNYNLNIESYRRDFLGLNNVSSTTIRKMIANNDLNTVQQFLSDRLSLNDKEKMIGLVAHRMKEK